MSRKMFSCDFETTTKLDDCRVWAYGYMEIGNLDNYKIGNSLDEFMQWVMEIQADLYFHNLKFDGAFIVNWLEQHGFKWSNEGLPNTYNTIISKMGQWYMIDICFGYRGKRKLHTVIYDSLKKLPFPVKKIAKDFQLPLLKGDIDYHTERPVGHEITPEEYEYIKNDIEIIARALDIQFKQGLDRMTAGSDSLKGFKDILSTKKFNKVFPKLSLPMDKEIRKAYRGGFTWLNDKYKEKEIGEGMVFDVNSLYPSQMYSRPLPYGAPIVFQGKYEKDEQYPLYIQRIRFEFELKEGYIPTIQIKKNPFFKGNEYLKNSGVEPVELYLTNVDLELIQEHYELYNVEYIDGFKFREKTGLFKDFIDKWTYVKTHEEGAKKQLAKLMLNSLYGKFASNPDVTGKVPYLKDDGSLGFRVGDEEYKDPVYTPMGVFITAWARFTTITAAQACYDRIIYCDTDSIHLTGTEVPEIIKDIVDPKKLGYWAHESTFKRAKYLRQKTYIQDIYVKEVDGKLKECSPDEATTTKFSVKCAGMTDTIKKKVTFDNFAVGFSSMGKPKPVQVNGGVVLVDSVFTIK
ncbi:DNA polymerase [Bacillus phage Nf]|uniref:DNA polymerase n=1 Tax=Bacillus phage Nf TaxID=2992639 RepID=DPOL_BPNF|nr:DNA polymerase [Bacillus phage Nf]B7SSM2.1 RecName: Full=DNA polymerase; AltName: Full=Gene product 2; Short=gp2; AltName: Full=Protein p2 [Bacillus phage Nf]ACH57069.1 DNA polymerase [Bacillus phage Nf]